MDVRPVLTRPKVRAAAGFLVAALGVLGLGVGAQPSLAAADTKTASSLTVVVNKTHPLQPITYAPVLGSYNLAKPASDAFIVMRSAMAKAGAGDLVLISGFRSYASQKAIFNRNVGRFGRAETLKITALPGYSEHQTGLAADLGATGQGCRAYPCFANTKAGKWLAANSWQFGFILRYPNGATAITGYDFEPWHFRFVGKQTAKAMHLAKATVLETFFGLPPAPAYLK